MPDADKGPKAIRLEVGHLREEIARLEEQLPESSVSAFAALSASYAERLRLFADLLEFDPRALYLIPQYCPTLMDELEELSSWLTVQRPRDRYFAVNLLVRSGFEPAYAKDLAERPARAGCKPTKRQKYIKAFELLQDGLNYQQVLNQLHDCKCEIGKHKLECRDGLRKGVAQVKRLLAKYGIEVVETKSIRN